MSAYHNQEHHHAAIRANALGNPLSFHGLSFHGEPKHEEAKRSAMALPCVIWAFGATRDSSLAVSIFGGIRGGRDEKREVDSMAEDDGT